MSLMRGSSRREGLRSSRASRSSIRVPFGTTSRLSFTPSQRRPPLQPQVIPRSDHILSDLHVASVRAWSTVGVDPQRIPVPAGFPLTAKRGGPRNESEAHKSKEQRT
jgi:hypothetical protein